MRTICCIVSLTAIALLGTLSATAYAGIEAPESAPKDYSRNAVTGEYLPDWEAALLARGEALQRQARPAPTSAPMADARFSWRDAGIGATFGFVLAGAVVLVARRPPRRLAPRS